VTISCTPVFYDFKEVTGSSMVGRLSLDLELRETKTGTTVWTHLYNHDEPVTARMFPPSWPR